MKHWTAASFAPEHGDPLSGRPRPGHFILDRWEVLQLVKDTSRQTGLGEREIAVLAAHLGVLTRGPVRADQLLVSYAQVSSMLGRANCMDERRFRRGEARLEELGFVTRHLSGNGRRYPVRDASGQVVEAYGIDLRPLFLRHGELIALRDAALEDARRLNALRSRLSASLTAAKRRVLAECGEITGAFAVLATDLRNLLRRASASMSELLEGEAQLARLEAEGSAAPDRSTGDGGQDDRHSDVKEKEIHDGALTEIAPADPRNAPGPNWHDLTEIAALYPNPPQTEPEYLRIIFEFSGFVGVKEPTLRRLMSGHGPGHLAEGLNLVARKMSEITNPDGYLAAFVRRRAGAV
ncbi:helix-turn-helix domain-containing protein [Marinibacterium sp. SX1]|uniref:helix-turn-helix domain-containing protein n=1 Tax=Marinibacterium sp. SX1 TaxID=3388424 RepID=UPI003D162ECA